MVRFMAQTPKNRELAKNILYTLHVAKITHKDLATHLHISPSTVARKLRTPAASFTYGQLDAIAELAKVPVRQLLPKEDAA